MTGKTFKETNGFSNGFLEKLLKKEFIPGCETKLIRGPGDYPTASAYHKDSVARAKLKNRINYLKGVIATSQKELIEAEKKFQDSTY